ncbi:MAG: hypothetical protein HOH13_00725 [Crocinitomicaceae bacterium]|jgi:hypothetical protein|nr:hypothetical protein [Crocinitomicaceae bacterium]MBT5402001.1 hypothetical protein [Crocinitomicaceae bacterium]MBT6028803.1 hypothetical protein [Crocinitomicaceae bacterium]MBT6515290.1 hypothetical protein [Crocinitomicaceae bacterium]
MKSNRILIWTLAFSNLLLVILMVFDQSENEDQFNLKHKNKHENHPPFRPNWNPSHFHHYLKDSIGLNEIELKRLKELQKEMATYFRSRHGIIVDLKKAIHRLGVLNVVDTAARDSLIQLLCNETAQLDIKTMEHFSQLSTLGSDKNQKQLKKFILDAIERLGPPPPPQSNH